MSFERELRTQFEARQPLLAAWGLHVQETITAGVREHLDLLPVSRKIDNFFKIPTTFRVKDSASFLTKALHRGKTYTDPLSQITDQVGVRFVVLLSNETEIFGSIIDSREQWETSQDRDYERERAHHPHSFDYESNHFIIRPSRPFQCGGITIPSGIPCEVQVRTLLQHAYAELSHDRLYKPECKVPDRLRRLVARGSALLETTDHMFCDVSRSLEEAMRVLRAGHDAALIVANEKGLALRNADPQLSLAILRHWPQGPVTQPQIEDLLRRKDYIVRLMAERQSESLFYAHPVGLLGYLLVDTLGRDVQSHWPFDRSLLEQIAADLGIGLTE